MNEQIETVDVEVVAHGSHNGKPIIQLEIPAWQSRYPTTLYGVSDADYAALPMGAKVSVTLKADRLKDGKDGSEKWHYYWSLAGAWADTGNIEPVPQRPLPAPQQQPQRGSTPAAPARVDTETAIRRAVALKAAVDFSPEDFHMDDVLNVATRFESWLKGSIPGYGHDVPYPKDVPDEAGDAFAAAKSPHTTKDVRMIAVGALEALDAMDPDEVTQVRFQALAKALDVQGAAVAKLFEGPVTTWVAANTWWAACHKMATAVAGHDSGPARADRPQLHRSRVAGPGRGAAGLARLASLPQRRLPPRQPGWLPRPHLLAGARGVH